MKKNAIVIGAGFAGLSGAAHLAKNGWNVTVLEQNDRVGGRARLWESEGYTFDMGPSWYLMPEVFDRHFSSLGEKREDYYTVERLDPAYRVFFEGGRFHGYPLGTQRSPSTLCQSRGRWRRHPGSLSHRISLQI